MCGIIGYVGEGEALPVLVEGIRLMSYRGYDSAGVAVARDGTLRVEKDKGRIEDLAPTWDRGALAGKTGIGHTRWATHGRPSRVNAHPADRRERARSPSCTTASSRTTSRCARSSRPRASSSSPRPTPRCSRTCSRARSVAIPSPRRSRSFAAATVGSRWPSSIAGSRASSSPSAAGRPSSSGSGGERRSWPPTSAPSRGAATACSSSRRTRSRSSRARASRSTASTGAPRHREAEPVRYDEETSGKGEFPHWMLKEIHEQPDRLRDLVSARLDLVHGRVRLDEISLTDADLAGDRARRPDRVRHGVVRRALRREGDRARSRACPPA